MPPTPTPASGGRVTTGLQALYTFDEGAGSTVYDSSDVGTPLNLTIADADNVSWLPGGGLSIDTMTAIISDGIAHKLIDATQATNELTLEAWINPLNVTQEGPARIISLSDGAQTRNFTLGQGLWRNRPTEVIDVRLRTTDTDNNGRPSLTTPDGSITPDLMHIVFTRHADGTTSLYINGLLVASDTVNGDFSNWDAYTFILANESDGTRGWLGELHLVAVYSQALTAVDVTQNYSAGP